MKLKKEYLILAAIIVALSLYLFLHKTDRAHYELPTLLPLSKAEISKIEITRKGTPIVLNKKNGSWSIGPEGYPANNDKIMNILSIIENLTLTAMVSESKDYSRYELDDEHKVNVKAYIGKALKREFEIGKTAPSYRHTFVRLQGDDLVYHARENFRNRFEVAVADLRDKQVLVFDKTEIKEIRLSKNGRSTVCALSKTSVTTGQEPAANAKPAPKQMPVWENPQGKTCDEKKLNRLLVTLSNLRCEKYIENKKKEDFTDPICSIELKGTQNYSLAIFAKADDEKGYPAITSSNKYPFLLPEGIVQSIIKAPEEMLGKTETKAKENQENL